MDKLTIINMDRDAGGKMDRAVFLYLVLPVLSILLLVGVVYGGQKDSMRGEILKNQQQYREIKRRAKKARETARNISLKEISILSELQKTERSIRNGRKSLISLKKRLNRVDFSIRLATGSIATILDKKRRLITLLEKRLTAVYKMREGGDLRIIMSYSSAGDMERRYRYMKAVIAQDSTLIKEYGDSISSLKKEIKRRKELWDRQSRLKDRKMKALKRIKSERRKRLALLRNVREKKEFHLRASKELESAASSLQSLISLLKKKEAVLKRRDAGFYSMKGALPMPVQGDIISFYGRVTHPRFHTVTINNGIFIKAGINSKIRSVFRGKVIYTGWLKGYGQIMIIDHGDGYYTLFAHISKIMKGVGSDVQEGSVVALVGETGSLRGPGLYFEVRKNGLPRNPVKWLAKK